MSKRDDGFSRRLRQSCDANPDCPAHGDGRYLWISKKMGVTMQAVRLWFLPPSDPESTRPRLSKMQALAKLLNVDAGWLATGTGTMQKPDFTAQLKHNEANVHLLYGMYLAAGGRCALPEPTDPRREYVDFYVILDSKQSTVQAIRACPVRETGENTFEVAVPQNYEDVRCIAIFQGNAFSYHLVLLPPALIEANKQKFSGDFLLEFQRTHSDYYTKKTLWPRIRSNKDL